MRRKPIAKLPLFLVALISSAIGISTAPIHAAEKIYLGIDVLEQKVFRAIAGQRVGLLTHPAGVNRDGVSTIDVLRRAPNVRLVALFGPEHGIYGDEKANVPVDDKIDPRTGLPVYSSMGTQTHPKDARRIGYFSR